MCLPAQRREGKFLLFINKQDALTFDQEEKCREGSCWVRTESPAQQLEAIS